MDPLTQRQEKILSFIRKSSERNGYPPTIREICEEFGIASTNGVSDHLKALEKKGYLVRNELKSRALHLVDTSRKPAAVEGGRFPALSREAEVSEVPESEIFNIPVVGKVAAGAPILAHQNVTDHVRIDSFLLGGASTARRVFALRVTGDSMIGDGIFDGDYIFVKKQLQAQTGEIVVALIEEEATVKRYFPEKDRIRFQPSNPRLKPIYVHRAEFRETQIIGVVVGVYRKVSS